jgi:fructose-specific phosphotransferase system IIC component
LSPNPYVGFAIMNTSGGVSGFISGVVLGYFVTYATEWLPALGLPVQSGVRDYRYDLPLVPVTAMLLISAGLWLKIDPTRELIPEEKSKLTVSRLDYACAPYFSKKWAIVMMPL